MSVKKLNGENYIIPPELKCNPHKHRDEKNWVSLWFYKNRTKTKITPDQLKCDKIITSKLEYQKNIMYKMSQMSEEDEYFDYYFKLKDDIKKKNLIKKNNRYRTHSKSRMRNNKNYKWKEYQGSPHEVSPDGKFIVRFR